MTVHISPNKKWKGVVAVQQLKKLNLSQTTNKHIFTPVGIEIIKKNM